MEVLIQQFINKWQ
uniref:Uncharacterized protein n=1 Tax=Arundo donax TaxID=35708 RepID=A0A0A9CBH8_ARUDO